MRDETKDRVIHVVTLILCAIIVFGGMVLAWKPYRNGVELRRRYAELKKSIEAKKAERDQLKEYQQRFRTDADFVEKIARQNRRVFPGELVFIFEN